MNFCPPSVFLQDMENISVIISICKYKKYAILKIKHNTVNLQLENIFLYMAFR